MSQKRCRSFNWDDEEKKLFCSVLKEYAPAIESKSLDTNSNKMKNKAWEAVHKKFNELNGRQRQLNQLKIKWKVMKRKARKTHSTFKEANKTGSGARPTTSDGAVIEVNDLLKPTELLWDHNLSKQKIILNNIPENGLKSRMNHDKYVSSMISNNKRLKDEEHTRRMEMAEQEHAIKMEIHKEKLKCAIIEREILEIKKMHEENI